MTKGRAPFSKRYRVPPSSEFTVMNKVETATHFLQMCAQGDVRAAYDRHVAEHFVHHNAWLPGDRESLLRAMEASAAMEPNKSFEVKQVIGGGDRVVVLSHLVRASGITEYAVVHILRFEQGRIVELWDPAQEVVKDSPNALGMF